MRRAFLRTHGKGGLELIEEAFVLLRTCPLEILAIYFLGSVPFTAGLLLFCAEMSRDPEAADYVVEASLGVTGLFLWMKFCHARFGRALLAHVRGEEAPPWRWGEMARTMAVQAVLHAAGVFAVPLAFAAVLPSAWVYGFFQSGSALDDGQSDVQGLCRAAARQGGLWPKQSYVIVLTLSGFAFFVFLGWIVLGFLAPQAVKMVFEIESVFTYSPFSLVNTTFFAAMMVLTYLSVDPLAKTCYVLRCFYGKSLQSGDDLRTDLRRLRGRMAVMAAALWLAIGSVSPAEESGPAPTPAVRSADLDRSIAQVIEQRKYNWRAPRPEVEPEGKEWMLFKFCKDIFRRIGKLLEGIGEWIKKLMDWILRREKSRPASDFNWVTPQVGLLFAALAGVLSVLAIVMLRLARARRRARTTDGEAVAMAPDLTDENTAADELPEDDWTRIGRRFLEQGELRLAVRAFYLGSLAHLAARGLITIKRSKSNRDYERELGRRGRAWPELSRLFGENVGMFDRIWYGLHEVKPEMVQRFLGNLEKMKGAA